MGTTQMVEILRLADSLISSLEELLKRPDSEREPRINDSQIKKMICLISERKQSIVSDSLPLRKFRFKELGWEIIDSWPLGTSLGGDIRRFEELYLNL